MKQADNPVVIRINGNNNKVIVGESQSHLPTAIAIAIGFFIGIGSTVAVLAVSFCCPEKLADCVRFILSIALHS